MTDVLEAHKNRPVLRSLQPIGVGTPDSESAQSYVGRLAKAHGVPWQTLHKFINCCGSQIYQELRGQPPKLDAPTPQAAAYMRRVAGMVGNPCVAALGLSWLAGRVRAQHVFRANRAWCAACCAETSHGHALHVPMIWGLASVTHCARHGVRLKESCPECGAKSSNRRGGAGGWSECTSCGGALAAAGIEAGDSPSALEAAILEQMAKNAITPYGDDMFGDKVNLYDGSMSFEQTDLALQGNNALPVALIRGATPGKHAGPASYGNALGDWAWKLPRIGGTFSATHGWMGSDGTTARCSKYWFPADEFVSTPPSNVVELDALKFWHGTSLDVPGQGGGELLQRDPAYAAAPQNGGNYPLVTKSQWQIGCLATIQNGAGEGFYAISPSGVRYDFNWMAIRATDEIRAPGSYVLNRQDMYLYATQATDRFGNWVKYTYDASNPQSLQKIEASDGRVITVTNSGGLAVSATDGTRTVNYAYSSGTLGSALSTVTLPDGRQWTYNIATMYPPNILVTRPTDACDDGSTLPLGAQSFTGSITHPSGATGTFTMGYAVLYKALVQSNCNLSGGVFMYDIPPAYVNLALSSKQITGPGLATMQWSFAYSDSLPEATTCTDSTCFRETDVTNPDGTVNRHLFGNVWHVNEGLPLSDQIGWDGSKALQTTNKTYQLSNAGQPYPQQLGQSFVADRGDWFSARLAPVQQTVITQQATTFSTVVNQFDAQARAIQITKTGPGGSRTDTTSYYDNTTLWVLGQVQSVSSGSDIQQSNGFNTLGQVNSHSEFGILKFTRTFNADGTLASEADALGHTTTFASYMRGLPQSVNYPTGASESAVVNNLGKFTSYTDAANNTTGYAYDAMGRLNSITPPAGWAGTTLVFEPVATAEYDLPAGHWRLTVSQGNARAITYMDAMWRPVMTRTFDAGDEANTRKVVVKGYDLASRVAFESYAQRDFSSVTVTSPGRHSTYDAMGRVTQVNADSELGTLTTTTEYLDGFQTLNINPRGKQSTQSFWALEDPRGAALATISVPAGTGLTNGMTVNIARDLYGKALSITRGDGTVNVTRGYVYDANQRLCKTLEPEVVATVQSYDAAGNVTWRAPGVNLPSSTCDQGSVPAAAKISYTYNELNMLTGTTYGDGSPSVTRTYWPDGQLNTVNTSDGSNWSYAYNSLRLLTNETLSYAGQSYSINHTYDTLGHLSGLVYPAGGPTVNYSPNALGEVTAVSGYASGISYHPNGAVAGYTLAC
jgi:YD repeat-containing protein